MINCSIFKLNILSKNSIDCNFLFTWGEGQQLTVNLKYPSELIIYHQEWQQLYYRAYSSNMRGRVDPEDELIYTPDSIDWKNKLATAEIDLINQLNIWLGCEELLKMREKIRNESIKLKPKKISSYANNCVKLFIACDNTDLLQLPWEAWNIDPQDIYQRNIHICRSVVNIEEAAVNNLKKRPDGKVRILAILAHDPKLDISADRKAILTLKKVSNIEIVELKSEKSADKLKRQFIDAIEDERGWDILIFCGHSDENKQTGGCLQLAPHASISISEIEEPLTKAKNQGLKVAVFNSCKGLDIAGSLIQIGLNQVVVMREKIHDSAANSFLQKFCQNLAGYKNIHQSLLESCQYLQSEKITYPSAYLVPSLFCNSSSSVEIFRIEKSRLKKFWQNWQPTQKESIVFAVTLFLSILMPVPDVLLDARLFVQSIYRDNLHKIGLFTIKKQPPVFLVSVDQDSIYAADKSITNFKVQPIDRLYIAQLIDKLSQLGTKNIGIEYLLDMKEDDKKGQIMYDSIKTACFNNKVNFVLAVSENNKLTDSLSPENKQKNNYCSFIGDGYLYFWDVTSVNDSNCLNPKNNNPCSFSYLLAKISKINEKQYFPINQDYRQKIKNIIKNNIAGHQVQNYLVNQVGDFFGMRTIIDFSLPPDSIYTYLNAKDLLEPDDKYSPDTVRAKKNIKNQVAIIAPGVYNNVKGESNPLALNYWCSLKPFLEGDFNKSPKNPNRSCFKELITQSNFTTGQAQSYTVHHWQSQHLVRRIPDWWTIILATFLGKGIGLSLLRFRVERQRKIKFYLICITILTELVIIPILHIVGNVIIPVVFPTFILWFFITLNIRRINNV